jgi:hypothetical protein
MSEHARRFVRSVDEVVPDFVKSFVFAHSNVVRVKGE